MPSYRSLDSTKLIATADKIIGQIEEIFPHSGLAGVANAFGELVRETIGKVHELERPLWRTRIFSGLLILIVVIWAVIIPFTLNLNNEVSNWAEFMEGTDAALHLLVILGGGLFFIASWETRKKRHSALDALSELRSLAHIIDMHQITKDPGLEHIIPVSEGMEDHRTVKSDAQLALYLDFSSDMLSIVGKMASLYAKSLHDRTVLDAVNEIESLSNGLCSKLWQKIMIINHIADSHAHERKENDSSAIEHASQ